MKTEPTMGDILRRGRALCAELARDAEREWAAEREAKALDNPNNDGTETEAQREARVEGQQ